MADIITLASSASQMSTYEELYREYLDDRILILNDEISENVIEDYIMYILKWNRDDKNIPADVRKPIRFYISSPGGSVFDANILCDIIAQSKTPVIGIGLDLIASAAYLIYLACHIRYSFKNSVFLQHEGEMSIENSRSKFKQTAEFFDSQEKTAKEYILSRTNMTPEFYDEIYEQEFWMTADKAKSLGVVDYIIGEDCDLDEVN